MVKTNPARGIAAKANRRTLTKYYYKANHEAVKLLPYSSERLSVFIIG